MSITAMDEVRIKLICQLAKTNELTSALSLGDTMSSPLSKSLRENHYVTTVDVLDGADVKCDLEAGLPRKIVHAEGRGGGKFDVVVAGEFFEHIYNLKSLLIDVKRFIKRDGCLVLSVPNTVNLKDRLRVLFGVLPFNHAYCDKYEADNGFTGHVRDFSLSELRWYLDGAGFRIVSVLNVGLWLVARHLIIPHWCCPSNWSDILVVKACKKECRT